MHFVGFNVLGCFASLKWFIVMSANSNLDRKGIMLEMRRIPVPVFLDNIRKKLDSMPEISRLQRQGSKRLTPEAKRLYSKLVNAFGWSAGQTGDMVQDPRLSLSMEGLATPAPAGRSQPRAAKPKATARKLTATQTTQVIADMHQKMKRFRGKNGRKLHSAICSGNGGRTKGFPTEQALFEWAAETYGTTWHQQLKTK